MTEPTTFALVVLLVSAAGLAAVLSNRLTHRLRVPAPVVLFATAAAAAALVADAPAPTGLAVERIVSIALVLILFDGGMHIGWARFRRTAASVLLIGVLGTVLTAALGAVLIHAAFGLSWFLALLAATAVAPTDPAVVFSVLGNREIAGRSGSILQGESGANDPVGIALMVSLIAAGEASVGAFGGVAVEFLMQMSIGAAVGLAGGWMLQRFMQVSLPAEPLYALRTTASAFAIFGVAAVTHGSGFLAVFVAGIVIGDGTGPYRREVERFQSVLASLGEIVAFIALGLTVDVHVLLRSDVWVPGLVLGVALLVVIRPLAVGVSLGRGRLRANELGFVMFAGLKGAVPILLAELLRAAHVPQAERLFGIVVVVVVLSVLVQGGLVPTVAQALRLQFRAVEPEPWSLGVRLREEPADVHWVRVQPGSDADGMSPTALAERLGDVWISAVVRDGALVPLTLHALLRSGDDVLLIGADSPSSAISATFGDAL